MKPINCSGCKKVIAEEEIPVMTFDVISDKPIFYCDPCWVQIVKKRSSIFYKRFENEDKQE